MIEHLFYESGKATLDSMHRACSHVRSVTAVTAMVNLLSTLERAD